MAVLDGKGFMRLVLKQKLANKEVFLEMALRSNLRDDRAKKFLNGMIRKKTFN